MSAKVTLEKNDKTLVIKTTRNAPASPIAVDTSVTSSTPDALTVGRLARKNTTAGDIVANLPPASSVRNGQSVIMKNEIGANNVNVTPGVGDLIDSAGVPHAVLPGVATEYFSNGISNWTAR